MDCCFVWCVLYALWTCEVTEVLNTYCDNKDNTSSFEYKFSAKQCYSRKLLMSPSCTVLCCAYKLLVIVGLKAVVGSVTNSFSIFGEFLLFVAVQGNQ